MSDIKINYNETFATKHSRDYYRGKSFHYSGKWLQGVHYVSDDYNVDFVVHDQVLLACAKSHLSNLDNEPVDFLKDSDGNIIGVVSKYWDFVLAGINGFTPGIRINNENLHWEICDNINNPEWIDSGVKSKFEFSDLTEEEIEEIQEPMIDELKNYTKTEDLFSVVSCVVLGTFNDFRFTPSEEQPSWSDALSTFLQGGTVLLKDTSTDSSPKISCNVVGYYDDPDGEGLFLYGINPIATQDNIHLVWYANED